MITISAILKKLKILYHVSCAPDVLSYGLIITRMSVVASKEISDLSKVQTEAGAPAPGSGKKVNWTSTHLARHEADSVGHCACAHRDQEVTEQPRCDLVVC
jgi:hypothetical protein